jgi:hypothetical protein
MVSYIGLAFRHSQYLCARVLRYEYASWSCNTTYFFDTAKHCCDAGNIIVGAPHDRNPVGESHSCENQIIGTPQAKIVGLPFHATTCKESIAVTNYEMV